MILVIADDFTGAAEMAGICLGYGLRVMICTEDWIPADTDVLIISTDSRSMDRTAALERVSQVTREAVKMQPGCVYKKIDSVLRGFVADELLVQLELLGLHKAVIAPANPSLGRIISGGKYFINGIEIAASDFAKDPEFAIGSSDVKEMLGGAKINLLQKGSPVVEGLNIAESETVADAGYWASQVDRDCLPAGSGDFFDALLQRKYIKVNQQNQPALHTPHLYVSGTSFTVSKNRIREQGGACVAYIAAGLITGALPDEDWLTKAGIVLQQYQRLIIAFDDSIDTRNFDAVVLRNKMAEYVKAVVDRFGIQELLIEGGATAAAVFQALGARCFEPLYEWERGIVQMKTGHLTCIVKPGSYELPPVVKELYGML
ncbi:four-carbon acid sugar kinase family protein [Niabella soli]|nr:four-carbon acid sugar kinase family protein [Niabella soli]